MHWINCKASKKEEAQIQRLLLEYSKKKKKNQFLFLKCPKCISWKTKKKKSYLWCYAINNDLIYAKKIARKKKKKNSEGQHSSYYCCLPIRLDSFLPEAQTWLIQLWQGGGGNDEKNEGLTLQLLTRTSSKINSYTEGKKELTRNILEICWSGYTINQNEHKPFDTEGQGSPENPWQ